MLVLDVEERSGWSILTVSGDLDVASTPQVRSEIVRVLAMGSTDLVLDLSRVDFLDSFGLGVLVGALRRVKGSGGRLVLVVTEHRLLDLFALTGLDAVFQIVSSVDAAVAA